MKVVYVGDNRNRGNFGCRATSTALSQLISEKNEIVGVVSGKYTNFDNGELFFHKIYTKNKRNPYGCGWAPGSPLPPRAWI